ncbi:molybdopterin-dependent oxidoreductase [Bacillus sp. 03113]|uniref:molybdopterin-dependent oxidoreductase n=1 Tax=Bacillus sp. 03113 TaxID=2578211 RepID=UPI00114117B2|nr:molybdopterin-dependent oxidoreductase [Bacillus sp. 03113]
MNWNFFFERGLNVRKKLTRLHHLNAIMFLVLSITGFILFSSSFRSALPSIRVGIRSVHVWIGIISCLPFLFYLPKMKNHLFTLRKRKNNRLNLHVVLTILVLLIVSGFLLTFHRELPLRVVSASLFVHDIATWFGVPYAIYHSMTRSKWFKALEKSKIREEPMVIDDYNPIYKRRTFLRVTSGGVIALLFAPVIVKWLKTYFPSIGETTSPSNAAAFTPLPAADPSSLPPIGGGRNGEFRYYTVTEMPSLSSNNWTFTIDGLVEQSKTYNWNQFIELKRSVQVSDFHCITGWSVYNITWEGIPLHQFLKEAGVKGKAKYVKFYSSDGVYTDTLTIDQAMMEDMMVALMIDGELISQKNGGPVRLITPKMYAYKSVKWLNRIELIEKEHTGYWEERGYSKDAWV